MTSFVCPTCKGAHRVSFWELHARLGQCYAELETGSHGGPLTRSTSENLKHDDHSPGYTLSRRSVRLPSAVAQHVRPPSDEALIELERSPANSQGQGSVPLSSYRRPVGPQPSPMSTVGAQPSPMSYAEDLSAAILNTGRRASFQSPPSAHADQRFPDREYSRGSGQTPEHRGRRKSAATLERRSQDIEHFMLGSEPVKRQSKAVATVEDAMLSSRDLRQLLQPHECWQKVKTNSRHIATMRTTNKLTGVLVTNTSVAAEEGPVAKGRLWHHLVLLPGRPFRNLWDILAVLFLVHDMIVIPLRFFDMPNAIFLEVLAWFTQVFWNLDVIATFLTGYYEDGNLILEPVRIAMNYAKTWLLFDIIVVSIDWIILFLAADSDAQGVHRLSKTVRLLRFLRMVRILRLAKISRMSEAVQEQIQSQAANIHYSLFKSIFRLLLLTHLLACAWYGIGRLSGEEWGDHSWVKEIGLTERTLGYQYTTCYHWAFCQMGVGGVAIYPTNTYERSFGICAAFLALMTFSTLVSKMTSLMSSLNKLKDEETEQFRLLRRYLVYNDIPLHLSQRIVRFLQHGYRIRHEALSAGSHLPILDLLSQSLRGELQLERHRGPLTELQFIHHLPPESRQTIQVMQKLALNALGDTVVAHDDVVFVGGDTAEAAYFVQSGRLNYLFNNDEDEEENGDNDNVAMISVSSRTWVAEMALWTPWNHLGDLISDEVSRLVVLHVEQFCKCVRESGECQSVAAAYAQDFVNELKSKPSNMNDLFLRRRDRPSIVKRQDSMKSAKESYNRCCRFWKSWNTDVQPMNG